MEHRLLGVVALQGHSQGQYKDKALSRGEPHPDICGTSEQTPCVEVQHHN